MDILFLGASGNISAACVAELIEQQHSVSGVTRGIRPLPEGCNAMVADVRDKQQLERAVADRSFDAAISFLTFTPEQLKQELDCLRGKVTQFLFISSATVYEKPPRALPITEETPLGNPYSEYARNKQACEELLAQHAEAHDLRYTIVRPSHTYCEQWMPNPISSAGYTLAARLKAGKPVIVPDDGQGLWTLTTSEDFAVGLAGLVGNPAAYGETFHITSDQPLTWRQILREAALAVNVENPVITAVPTDFICEVEPTLVSGLKGDKSHHAVFDNAKIKAVVPEFECRMTVRDGMRRSAAWFVADTARQVADTDIDARYERILAAWSGGC